MNTFILFLILPETSEKKIWKTQGTENSLLHCETTLVKYVMALICEQKITQILEHGGRGRSVKYTICGNQKKTTGTLKVCTKCASRYLFYRKPARIIKVSSCKPINCTQLTINDKKQNIMESADIFFIWCWP